ncbi:MAG: cytidylyltransferase domain-containing protein [Candidatus Hermodarchaeota archaeon]
MINQKILAIIPARGGSKRIFKKNIKELCGKPLIYYSINSARHSKYIDKVIVSTNDEEIKDISKNFGSEIIERPNELAKDDSPTIDVIFHVLNVLKKENYEPTLIILIQPTSPLRNIEDIDKAIELSLKSKNNTLISVSEVKHPPYWCFKIKKGFLKPLFNKKYLKMRGQDFEKIYSPNGAIFISNPNELYKSKTFYSKNAIPYIMPLERGIDIDNEFDFMIAEFLMQKSKINTG